MAEINMLHRTYVTRWLPLCLFCCMTWPHESSARERTAFYYGPKVPSDLIAAYDQVVVEPSHIENLKDFEAADGEPLEHRAEPVAYLSVGEVAESSDEAKGIPKSWVLAENQAWSSLVMDLGNAQYRTHLLAKFDRLWAAGYHRFFLDTLDSYQLAPSSSRAERAEKALVRIIVEMKKRHPEAHLIVNRGFEILAQIKGEVSGVVAESLFDRWDAAAQRYTRVPEDDRRWLLQKLEQARDAYGLPVTVIDYRPPHERREARETARKIRALGFEPWVTDGALSSIGVGSVEIMPRRVLLLGNEPLSADPEALRLLAPVLEYLGYLPEYRQVPKDWSELGLEQGYQGVVTWFSSGNLPAGYASWMLGHIERGVRFAVFGVPGFALDGGEAKQLGITLVSPGSAAPTRVAQRDASIGFEAPPPARPFDGPLVQLAAARGTEVHLRLVDGGGRSGVAIATTPWGGLALSHALALRGLHGERAWVVDPFAFVKSALALPAVPMPSATTEHGRRLAMVLVRSTGLGWPAAHGQPASGALLGDWLAENHAWPHAIDDGSSEPSTPETAADRAAAEQLAKRPFFERAALRAGTSRARGATASITQLGSMFRGAEPVGPIGFDSEFLPSGEPQAHPYRQVLDTFEFTDAPRRLRPVLVDYHGFMASSAGGRATLAAVYDWLEAEELYPIHVRQYVERARAWRRQVVARDVDGAWLYFGGGPLVTVRAPLELGAPCLAGSSPASVRALGDGYYVSFVPGSERRLVFGSCRLDPPHLVQSNGRVLRWDREHGAREHGAREQSGAGAVARLELMGHLPLHIELAGLPPNARCQLESKTLHAAGVSDARGGLTLDLSRASTGDARLTCSTKTGAR